MAEIRPIGRSPTAAGFVLGRKLDSIPFSAYHTMLIAVLALVGFVEGYDLSMTGLLLVLAKGPLHLTGTDIRWLAVGPTFMICVGGFMASAMSDHRSRKTVMQIGIAGTTFFTLLIPLVQSAEQLIILRLLTGLASGFAVSAPFPIAAELCPHSIGALTARSTRWRWRAPSPCCRSSPSCSPSTLTPFDCWHCRVDWRCSLYRCSSISRSPKARAGICAEDNLERRLTSSTRSSDRPAAACNH